MTNTINRLYTFVDTFLSCLLLERCLPESKTFRCLYEEGRSNDGRHGDLVVMLAATPPSQISPAAAELPRSWELSLV